MARASESDSEAFTAVLMTPDSAERRAVEGPARFDFGAGANPWLDDESVSNGGRGDGDGEGGGEAGPAPIEPAETCETNS